jgi:hypothetical protein
MAMELDWMKDVPIGVPTEHRMVSVVSSKPVEYMDALAKLGWVWLEGHHTEDEMREYRIYVNYEEDGPPPRTYIPLEFRKLVFNSPVRFYMDTKERIVDGYDPAQYNSYKERQVIEDTLT